MSVPAVSDYDKGRRDGLLKALHDFTVWATTYPTEGAVRDELWAYVELLRKEIRP